jgi:hypothetical protein
MVIHDERGVSTVSCGVHAEPTEPEERKVGYVLPVHSSNRLEHDHLPPRHPTEEASARTDLRVRWDPAS